MHKLLVVIPVLLSACATSHVRMFSYSVVPIAHGSITTQASMLGDQAFFDELGGEDVDWVGSAPRVDIRDETGTLNLDYRRWSYAGEGTLDADLQFGGSGVSEFDERTPLSSAVDRPEGGLGDFDFETSSGSSGDGDRHQRDLDMRLGLEIKGMAGMWVFGYRTVPVDDTYEHGDENTDIDAVFSGPYLGISLGF
jgi:hypothetical protein